MRTAIITTITASLFATAAAAQTSEPRTFSRDGRTYSYTQTTLADGKTVIEGQELATAGRFRLVVANGRVSGTSNGRPVSFRAPAIATQAAD